MKKAETKARAALVHACLEQGIEDHEEIKKIASSVAKNCNRQQVAGIKARKNFKW